MAIIIPPSVIKEYYHKVKLESQEATPSSSPGEEAHIYNLYEELSMPISDIIEIGKLALEGKLENVQEKMVEGAIAKYAKENALLSQVFVMDNKTPIAQVVEAAGKDVGAKVELVDYVRFQLGEGIEKEETDFAAEVAAAVAG